MTAKRFQALGVSEHLFADLPELNGAMEGS
jgi:hypothetical protein